MKYRILTLISLLLAVSGATFAQQKIHPTEQQQLHGMDETFVKWSPTIVDLPGKGIILYKYHGECRRANVILGTDLHWMEPEKEEPDSFKYKVDGWRNPTYSPDSTKIAYTLSNDLYSIDTRTGEIVRHTFDGSDLILNGYASWVYFEEIFGRASKYKAFWWSPDSKIIAYYRFDNSSVPMFPIYNSKGQHGSLNQTRYPCAGDPNPVVKIGFVSVDGGETLWADFNPYTDQYFGIPFWNADGSRFMVSWMPRSQDDLILYSVNPLNGYKQSVYKEHQDSWIDWMTGMKFTSQGMYIVRDMTGWQQIYFLSYDGTKFEQLTTGENWDVQLLKLTDKYLYFSAKREATTRVDLYRLTLKGKRLERVSRGDYNFTSFRFSEDGYDIAMLASNTKTPNRLIFVSIPHNGSLSSAAYKVVFDCKGEDFDKYAFVTPDVIKVTMQDGTELPALVSWPVDMDTTRKYPIIAFIYGGPDTPRVLDKWAVSGFDQWWANHGVIQVVLDNRASGHLGKRGMEAAYRHLNCVEVEDFKDGMRHFTALPYVDEKKVGVHGFSFGGTMTTLCVTEGNDVFKYGIAGGGVYDWALYDSHYTERYMDRPQDNPEGYAASRVLDRLSNYRGDSSNMLRITHGTGDDNVHFQNTLQLIDTLQKQYKHFELMIYPQALHGYRMKQAFHSQREDYIFWYKYLLDSTLPEPLEDYFKPKK